MTLFIHLGMQKTGTTYLQQALTASRSELKEAGLAYPSATAGLGPDTGAAHHFIPYAITGRDARISPIDADVSVLPDHIAAILQDVHESGDGVVSSEVFSRFEPHEITRLRECIPEADTKIVVYLRRQDEWMDSLFGQARKSGETIAVDEFVASEAWLLDYAQLLGHWADAFGRDNLIVRAYERLEGRDLWNDFMEAIGRPDLTSIQPAFTSANVSLPPSLTAVMHAMRVFGYRQTFGMRRMLESMSDKFPAEDGLHYLPADAARRIMEQYEASNRAVAEAYLGRSDLFLDRDPLPSAAVTEIDDEFLMQVFGGLTLELTRRIGRLERRLAALSETEQLRSEVEQLRQEVADLRERRPREPSEGPAVTTTQMPTPIPNLVVMGAQKSGTSSLHDALKQHPSVFMSTPLKEASFFFPEPELVARLHHYKLGRATDHRSLLDQYMLKGYEGEPFFGESPTDYSFGERPRAYGLPARISELQPEMRFLYIVRNPFERMLSAQLHNIGRTGRDPVQRILEGDSSPVAGLVKTSLYHYQLSAYLEHFDVSRFHVVKFEDFIQDQAATMRSVFQFLGLDEGLEIESIHSNASKLETFESTQKLPRAFLDEVHSLIVDDVAALADTTGIDVSTWDLSFDSWCADDDGQVPADPTSSITHL